MKNSVGGASRGEDAVGRRPPSADSAISRSRTPPVTLHRLSSSVGSRGEINMLHDLVGNWWAIGGQCGEIFRLRLSVST